ncbi:hypothetical protein ACWDA9_07945 [Streptomyces sp. NPDC001193]
MTSTIEPITAAPADELTRFPFDANGTRLPDEITHLLTREPVKKVRTIAGAEAWLVSSYRHTRQLRQDTHDQRST